MQVLQSLSQVNFQSQFDIPPDDSKRMELDENIQIKCEV